MGGGIWAMHFVGMLAFTLPVPVSYDVRLLRRSRCFLPIAATALGLSRRVQARGGLAHHPLPGGC